MNDDINNINVFVIGYILTMVVSFLHAIEK